MFPGYAPSLLFENIPFQKAEPPFPPISFPDYENPTRTKKKEKRESKEKVKKIQSLGFDPLHPA
jgi:hypothetical protein